MTEVLNLDEFKNTRSVTFGGKARTIRSMSVGEFIDNADFDKELAAAENVVDQTKLLIKHILRVTEDTTEKELRELDIDQLSLLLRYVRGEDLSEMISNSQVEEAQKAKPKKARRKKPAS